MNKFQIVISSDLEFEGMVVYIMYNDNQIITLSCDNGIEDTRIMIQDNKSDRIVWNIEYNDFLTTLKEGFKILKEVNLIE